MQVICEASHIRSQILALSLMVSDMPARGRRDENAADGFLVVQVRYLWAISRQVSRLAPGEALVTRLRPEPKMF
jgi:hypothetical protein